MLKYDPWATVARVEMEELVDRAARARQRREARKNSTEISPMGSTILQVGRLFRRVVRLTRRAAPMIHVNGKGPALWAWFVEAE